MSQIFNRPDQTLKRRTLRHESPGAERLLWSQLRRRTCGAKFRRQDSINSFVVDFYCPALLLVIEVDGPTHESDEAAAYDADRQAAIESLGVCFLRFTNAQVYNQLADVMETIEAMVKELQSKSAKDA